MLILQLFLLLLVLAYIFFETVHDVFQWFSLILTVATFLLTLFLLSLSTTLLLFQS